MKAPLLFALLAIIAATGLLSGCNLTDDGGLVTITGRVQDNTTGAPIAAATVRLLDVDSQPIDTQTTSDGTFTFEVEVDSTVTARVVAFKSDYQADTLSVVAVPEFNLPSLRFRLRPTGDDGGGPDEPSGSGNGASIVLVNQSAQSIGVLESGSVETAQLVFEVQDSSGAAIDLDHAVTLSFDFGAKPGGNEFLFPTTVTTDDKGRATVNLRSGTRAGVVQITATATANGRTFRSKPVSVAIHGGLPDDAHFSIAPAKKNFPGYHIYGQTNGITAYVGDKWGNPARTGTSVYFTTTGGIIEGSVLTNPLGQGTVSLVSSAPLPSHATYGPGYATITGSTADENEQTISKDLLVLFSGAVAAPVLSPAIAAIGQTYSLVIADQNGNPLTEGTSISVSVSGTRVEAVGDVSVTLDDFLFAGPGRTSFSFAIRQIAADPNDENPPAPQLDALVIEVNGPNGRLKASYFPSSGSGAVPEPVIERF